MPTCKCHSPAGWSLGRWHSTALAQESWTPPPLLRTSCRLLHWPPTEKSQSNNYSTKLFFFLLLKWSVTAREQYTNPVEAWLSAELVGPCRTEVIVWPEGLIECCDEVEESLPATLVTQRVLPILTALPQPGQHRGEKEVPHYLLWILMKNGCSRTRTTLDCTTHCEGLVALADCGGERASRMCGSPSWQNCLNICLSSPAILQE